MKISDIDYKPIEDNLKISDYENFLNIYVDKRGNYVFNLNTGLYIDVDQNTLPTIVLDHDAWWTTISYKIYETTRLAWLLMKVNKVGLVDLFNMKETGDLIYYVDPGSISDIIQKINGKDIVG